MKRGFTLIELLVVIAIIAILAAILFPVFAQAREQARAISCLSNNKQLGLSFKMYAQDYDELYGYGTYPGPRNWEVNPDALDDPPGNAGWDCFGWWAGFNPGDGGPVFGGCAYGTEFYRVLMRVQNGPYIKNTSIWYCPSDKFRTPSPYNLANGLQSYQWFPNWVYNANCCWGDGRYPDGKFYDLDNPTEKSDIPAQRILLAERGIFGWDGPDGANNCQQGSAPNANGNHPRGYNCTFLDGHAKIVTYGNKWRTYPMTGWPPECRPQ